MDTPYQQQMLPANPPQVPVYDCWSLAGTPVDVLEDYERDGFSVHRGEKVQFYGTKMLPNCGCTKEAWLNRCCCWPTDLYVKTDAGFVDYLPASIIKNGCMIQTKVCCCVNICDFFWAAICECSPTSCI
eukprot:TRINITY_DN56733_c0_g1_i1.p1 TRINITY_DN56733_c0_g1~~TRINITY_DN56733_c0_g1_i1.p1  ORF type:complete len:150 (+),score=21.82 TRINITY_DN56733_c0_g1_i1:66-452(+)